MVVEKDGNVTVVRLPARFSGKSVSEVLAQVHDEQKKGSTNIAIDFQDTAFVDSSAIGALVGLTKESKSTDTILSLRNLNDEMRELFSETGLDVIFNIETEEGFSSASVDIFETSVDIRLDITQETDSDMCIFHLSGVMNHPVGSRYFKQQFLLALAEYRKILVDFENLTFFDSLSVSVILNMNKLLKETGGSLRLCAANYIVDDLFATLNIGQIIPIFDTVTAAKADWE